MGTTRYAPALPLTTFPPPYRVILKTHCPFALHSPSIGIPNPYPSPLWICKASQHFLPSPTLFLHQSAPKDRFCRLKLPSPHHLSLLPPTALHPSMPQPRPLCPARFPSLHFLAAIMHFHRELKKARYVNRAKCRCWHVGFGIKRRTQARGGR